MRSYSEVQAEIEYFEGELVRLRQEAKQAQAREVEGARKGIVAIMKATGLTMADVLNSQTVDKRKLSEVKSDKKPKGEPLPPVYKNPDSDETWSGRGRCPKWLVDKDREQFRIQETA